MAREKDLHVLEQRKQLVFQYRAQGLRNVEIAKRVKDFPCFAGLTSQRSVEVAISRLMREEKGYPYPDEAPAAKTVARKNHILDSLPSPRLSTLKDFKEFESWLRKVLRPAFHSLAEEAARASELEKEVKRLQSEHEGHRCPDMNEDLREENEKLREKVEFLEKRIEALSRLTAHKPITRDHLVIYGGR